MPYFPSILIRYRYWILASLSLLLISEIAVVGVNIVPVEYEGVLGWLSFLTMVAWTGIVGMIGVGAPVDREVLNRGGRIILILSPALFATFILSPSILQSLFLLDLFWSPYLLLFVMVWIGIVVIFGATMVANHSRKSYLGLGVFPLLLITSAALLATAFLTLYVVLDLFERLLGSHLVTVLVLPLIIPFGALLIVLPTSLMIGALILRRKDLSGRPRTLVLCIVVAMISLGITVVALGSVIGIGIFLFVAPFSGIDAPGVAIAFIVFVIVLSPIAGAVPGTVLIGRMHRPIRSITVAGIGLVAVILVAGWYWYLTVDDGLDAFSGRDLVSAERVSFRAECPLGFDNRRHVFEHDGAFMVRGYTWWRFSADCR